jgi:integrase
MKPSKRLITFIQTSVNAAKPIGGKRTEYRVQDTRRQIMLGLVLEVLPGGNKIWRVHYDAKEDGCRRRRKVKLGTHSTSLSSIAKQWQTIRDRIDEGGDYVAEEKRRIKQEELDAKRSILFGKAAEQYLEEHAKLKARTWPAMEYKLKRFILPTLAEIPIRSMQRQDVRQLTDEIAKSAPTMADRIRQLISAIFAHAISRDRVEINPAKGISLYTIGEKPRPPIPAEALPALWPILEGVTEIVVKNPKDQKRAYMVARIAILTGLRISEVLGAQKDELSEIDALKPIWTLKAERTGRKRNIPHSVPLTPRLQELLHDALAQSKHPTQVFFPTLDEKKPYATVWYQVVDLAYKQAGVPTGPGKCGLHSMRHFATTQMAYMGVDRESRDRVTDHVGPHTRGEDRRYNHYDFYDQKLKALTLLDKRVMQLVEGEPAGEKVISIKSA